MRNLLRSLQFGIITSCALFFFGVVELIPERLFDVIFAPGFHVGELITGGFHNPEVFVITVVVNAAVFAIIYFAGFELRSYLRRATSTD